MFQYRNNTNNTINISNLIASGKLTYRQAAELNTFQYNQLDQLAPLILGGFITVFDAMDYNTIQCNRLVTACDLITNRTLFVGDILGYTATEFDSCMNRHRVVVTTTNPYGQNHYHSHGPTAFPVGPRFFDAPYGHPGHGHHGHHGHSNHGNPFGHGHGHGSHHEHHHGGHSHGHK